MVGEKIYIEPEVYRKHEQGYWFLASEADKITEVIELASIDLSMPMTTVYTDTEGILRQNPS